MTAAPASVLEALRQLVCDHPNRLLLNEVPLFVRRVPESRASRVAVVSGGGSGHEPMHVGFVGRGMLDAACPGHIFSSPGVDQITAAATAVESGHGCLFIVKNYPGDRMNFRLAVEGLPFETETVLVTDDIALPAGLGEGRRGIAGTFVVEKIAGAAAARGLDLKTCAGLARKAVVATRSIGAAWRWCSRSVNGRSMYDLPHGQISYGVGLHGEPGVGNIPDMGDARLLQRMIDDLVADFGSMPDDQGLLLFTNGLSDEVGTRVVHAHACALDEARRRGMPVIRDMRGILATCLDMRGLSVTLTILDEELLSLWDAEFDVCGFRPSSKSFRS